MQGLAVGCGNEVLGVQNPDFRTLFWGDFDEKMGYFGFLTFPKMFLKNFFFDPNRVEIEGFGGHKRYF